jgi:phosphatidylserine synthase
MFIAVILFSILLVVITCCITNWKTGLIIFLASIMSSLLMHSISYIGLSDKDKAEMIMWSMVSIPLVVVVFYLIIIVLFFVVKYFRSVVKERGRGVGDKVHKR